MNMVYPHLFRFSFSIAFVVFGSSFEDYSVSKSEQYSSSLSVLLELGLRTSILEL